MQLMALMAALQFDRRQQLSLSTLLDDAAAIRLATRPVSDAPTMSRAGRRRVRPASTTRPLAVYASAPSRWPDASDARAPLYRIVANGVVEDFRAYCEHTFIGPLEMNATDVAVRSGTDDAVVIGHSMLGTPVQRREMRRDVVLTTAPDLGRLVAGLLDDSGPLGLGRPALRRICRQAEGRSGGLGLDVQFTFSDDGPRMELAEHRAGIGCLVRAYADNRSAVVILFNSETGREAALQLAQRALGGR
jgi:hypothetical protein